MLCAVCMEATVAQAQTEREKAYAFELKDTLGYVHKLADYKGKMLVIDFWFTGCKGCVQVANMLREEVKPRFKGDSSVVFVAVSLDVNFLQWKRSIRSERYTSEGQLNLYTNGQGGKHPIYRYYGFSGAPQMLVIDPEGYVISKSVTNDGMALSELIEKTVSAYRSVTK